MLVSCETIREKDGLAKSSRNVYLSIDERKEAPYIYKSLLFAKETIADGELSVARIKNQLEESLSTLSGEIDYIEILSYPELTNSNKIKGKIIIAVAYKFQSARLIDNVIIDLND
jgi:pantoate--beta-alanine ligase